MSSRHTETWKPGKTTVTWTNDSILPRAGRTMFWQIEHSFVSTVWFLITLLLRLFWKLTASHVKPGSDADTGKGRERKDETKYSFNPAAYRFMQTFTVCCQNILPTHVMQMLALNMLRNVFPVIYCSPSSTAVWEWSHLTDVQQSFTMCTAVQSGQCIHTGPLGFRFWTSS